MELKEEIKLLKEKIKLLEKQKKLEEDLLALKRLSEELYPNINPYPIPYYPVHPIMPMNPWYTEDPLPGQTPIITCQN